MNRNFFKCTIIGLLFCGGTLLAQDKTTTTQVEENADKFKVETNHFFDNWFVGAGVGGQVYFGLNDKEYSFTDRITPSLNINVGKWFTPGLGLRLGVDASNAKGLTVNNSSWYTNYYNTGDVYTNDEKTYYEQKIKYVMPHAEALFNLSNILMGYKKDRFYNFIPYVGFGGVWSTNKSDHEDELTVLGGILNTFRLGNALDLTLDLKGNIFSSNFSHKQDLNIANAGSSDKIASVSIGLVYKFKKRGWDKGRTITNTVTEAKYDDAELNKLRKEVADLNKKLEDCGKNTKTKETYVDRSIMAPPLLITFQIDKWDLSKEARVNLGYFAKIVKSKPGVVYVLTGYADKGTGTPERNELLSQKRAEVVYNSLVKEFGVNADQLQTEHAGGVDNMFYDDPRLSRAVIAFEVKK